MGKTSWQARCCEMVDKNGDKFGEYVMKVDDEYAKYTRLRFLTQFGLVVVGGGGQFLPMSAQKGPKWHKNGQNLTLTTLLVVQNG